jgi:hypothetical protein
MQKDVMTPDPLRDPQSVWLSQETERPPVSLANLQESAHTLQAQGRRDFIVTSVVRVLLIAYFAVAAATSRSVATQVVDGVAIVFVIGTFYWAYKSVRSGAVWREQSSGDAGAMASLEFYRRELVRQRDSVQIVGWASGHLLILTVIVMAVFIGAEWSSRHPQDVAAALKDAPPMVRPVGPIVALIAFWVAAMIAYHVLGGRRRRTLQREIDSLEVFRKGES